MSTSTSTSTATSTATKTPPPPHIPILLLDGGLGTSLADEHGCHFDDRTPLWSSHLLISDPTAALRATHAAFARAGSDVLLSATYQASFAGFARTGDGIDAVAAAQLMRSAVDIARDAFLGSPPVGGARGGKVALSLGAYGATMVPSQEYSGRYDEERMSFAGLESWHWERMRAFVPGGERVGGFGDGDGGGEGLKDEDEDGDEEEEKVRVWKEVGFVAFETLPLRLEIEAVRRVMGRVRGRDFWIACVFPGEGNCLPDGSCVRDVVRSMLGKEDGKEGMAVPMGVGLNCTKVGKVEGLILEFESEVRQMVTEGEAEWPSLVVYPDGTNGEVYDTTTKQWVKKAAAGGSQSMMSWDETMWGIVKRARERGLWKSILVGGCCKTTPEDIGKLRMRIDESSS
ncbi:hypothetical protein LZ554_002246 [Drepanopeziza brunnea f. sp. 'monogermtubi']|nr:hypothetical protein LZ554_002246 [Drepanopeziza brunnea f. sp. 'monogermtubi']